MIEAVAVTGDRKFGRLLALAFCLMAAGCQTTLQGTPEASATQPVKTTLAFEGFVGVPQQAGDEVILALASAGLERRFAVVGVSDPTANYVLRGYLAPQAEGGTTAVSFVWDLFDRAGNRLQRLSGEARLPAASADGWSLVQGSGARAIAEASAVEIARFLNAPASAARVATVSPSGAAASPAVPQASLPASAASSGSPPARQSPARSVSVHDVSGLDAVTSGRLRSATEKALGDLGYRVAAPGVPSDISVSADATVNPAIAGRRLAAVVWRVSDGRGKEIGEVRQLTRLGQAGVENLSVLDRAVERMLPGIVALAPPRP